MLSGLPILDVLPRLRAALAAAPNLVLQAPPGAGKTTGVPLALLGQSWLDGRKIVMLEPRRLATRAAARRMAALLGEAVGETVGYRMRLDTRVGRRTRIEVVTDGVFTRMIQEDPGMEGIGAVLFDEIHERRLESDLGLAFAIESQSALRPDLRLVAMSATLDAAPLARLLGGAEIITATGRVYPVDIRHLDAPEPKRLAEAVADAVRNALRSEPGGILVFLPGGPEIRRVHRLLAARLPAEVDLFQLYGDLDQAEQDRALTPSPIGRRKLVLSSAIAETSLTLDGIRQVVDSGLARTSLYDPRSGMTRLETVKVSQAGAEQRAGRAGRTEPGIAWRLWPAGQHKALPERPVPEIATADLAPLALDLALWGAGDPTALPLPDPPPPAAFDAARRLLIDLGALDSAGRIAEHGRRMARLGLHPRLAHMVLIAADQGEGSLAAIIAALLGERDVLGGAARDADLRSRVELVAGRSPGDGLRKVRETARRIERLVGIEATRIRPARTGAVLALAYPDRIALRRAEGEGRFRLSGGQGAYLSILDPLSAEMLLAVADLDGQKPDARIWLAAPLDRAELEATLGDRIVDEEVVAFDRKGGGVIARRRTRLGALVLGDAPLADPPADRIATALLDAIRELGAGVLPWTKAAETFRSRVALLARLDGDEAGWPALDDETLLSGLDTWLTPYLSGKRSLAQLQELDLDAIFAGLLSWEQRRDLESRAPTHFEAPSGSRLPITYSGEAPVLAVRVQELFGLTEHPAICHGRVPLLLSLLSPANRPIQLTRDLPGFWSGSYKAVRADLRGRYPKHPWPEDPATAAPTARAKPRS